MVRKVRTRKYGKRKHRRSLKRKSKKTRHFRKRKTLKKQKRIKGGYFSRFLPSYFKPPEKVSLLRENINDKHVKYKLDDGKPCNHRAKNVILSGYIVEIPFYPVSIDEKVIKVKPDDDWAEYEYINYNQICDTFNHVGRHIDPNRKDWSSRRYGYPSSNW